MAPKLVWYRAVGVDNSHNIVVASVQFADNFISAEESKLTNKFHCFNSGNLVLEHSTKKT